MLLCVDSVCVVLKLFILIGVEVFFVLLVIIVFVLLYVIICVVWLMLCKFVVYVVIIEMFGLCKLCIIDKWFEIILIIVEGI